MSAAADSASSSADRDAQDVRLRRRTAEEVLADHIDLRERGRLDEDLERNYDPDVLVLTAKREFRGHDGVRECAGLLQEAVSANSYRFKVLRCGERVGFGEWTAQGEEAAIHDGVDTYLVEDGKIKAQTIHYTAVSSRLSMAPEAEAGGRSNRSGS